MGLREDSRPPDALERLIIETIKTSAPIAECIKGLARESGKDLVAQLGPTVKLMVRDELNRQERERATKNASPNAPGDRFARAQDLINRIVKEYGAQGFEVAARVRLRNTKTGEVHQVEGESFLSV